MTTKKYVPYPRVIDLQAEHIDRARRAICLHATDAAEADELMRMAGIHPSQEPLFEQRTDHSMNTRFIDNDNRKEHLQ